VTGRLKDLIIRGGENIYPREVEDTLTQHPAVSGAVVLGVPDAHWGEVVAAVIQLTDRAQAPTAGDLHTFVRQHLAPHKTPTAWYVSETLPTNAMGKLRKYRLRERIDAGELPALRP
jgi:acyl-CoA synthetase (AMP-forming)/AMP-acid ligase II